MRALRDSWRDAPQAIEELEQEGEVLVTRTQKDQQMRMVFYNEIKPVEGSGGMPVDQGMWRTFITCDDLGFQLIFLNNDQRW